MSEEQTSIMSDEQLRDIVSQANRMQQEDLRSSRRQQIIFSIITVILVVISIVAWTNGYLFLGFNSGCLAILPFTFLFLEWQRSITTRGYSWRKYFPQVSQRVGRREPTELPGEHASVQSAN